MGWRKLTNMSKYIYKNDNRFKKGQALLLVVVAMTVALALGVNVSVRTISNLSRTTRSDTASRVLSAAEAGAERFLSLAAADLETAAGGDITSACNKVNGTSSPDKSKCTLQFVGADDVNVVVDVSVGRGGQDEYTFILEQDTTTEVRVNQNPGDGGYRFAKVCWKSINPSYRTDLYLVTLGTTNTDGTHRVLGKRVLRQSSTNPYKPGMSSYSLVSSGGTGQIISADYSSSDSAYCKTLVTLKDVAADTIRAVRFRAIGGDAEVTITDVGRLPAQGYTITALGTLSQPGGNIIREVEVFKSYPYPSGIFDFSIFSGSGGWINHTGQTPPPPVTPFPTPRNAIPLPSVPTVTPTHSTS